MESCVNGCGRKAIRAGKPCRSCYSREKYGDCAHGCASPAVTSSGFCAACWKRGGSPPSVRKQRHDPQQRQCSQAGCSRRVEKHRGGLCSACYLLSRYGMCSSCGAQPAGGRAGRCRGCAARGGSSRLLPGRLVNTADQRWCASCSQVLPVGCFYDSASRPSGKSVRCRQCNRRQAKERSRRRRAEILEMMRSLCVQTAQGVCVKCRQELGSTWQVDHIIPQSWGGDSSWKNLQIMCAECNLSKSNTEAVDYRVWI